MLRFEKLPSPPMPKELELPQGISPRLARMLYARGARTGEAMEAFLHPSAAQLYDPFLFRDMDKAVARLREAAEKGQRICVYGDYDVDGVCAPRPSCWGPWNSWGPRPFTMSPPGTGRAMA